MYTPTRYWREIVGAISDETLDLWIANAEHSIPQLKVVASKSEPDSPVLKTIEIEEGDLKLYLEEKDRRQKLKLVAP